MMELSLRGETGGSNADLTIAVTDTSNREFRYACELGTWERVSRCEKHCVCAVTQEVVSQATLVV